MAKRELCRCTGLGLAVSTPLLGCVDDSLIDTGMGIVVIQFVMRCRVDFAAPRAVNTAGHARRNVHLASTRGMRKLCYSSYNCDISLAESRIEPGATFRAADRCN